MKSFLLILLGVVIGLGGGYVLFQHEGGLVGDDVALKLPLSDYFLAVLDEGDRVILTAGKFGYTLHMLSSEELTRLESLQAGKQSADETDQSLLRPGLELLKLAPIYEVVKVRRDHVVLVGEGRRRVLPASQIGNIERTAARQPAEKPEPAPEAP